MYGHRSTRTGSIRRPHGRRRISPFLGLALLAAALFLWGSGCNSQQSLRHQFGASVRPVYGDVGRLLKNAHYFKLMGRPEMAVVELEQAHLRDPANLKVLDALARCYDELGEFSRAQELYRAGLKLDPDNQALSNNLCYSYYLAGKYREAEKCFRETLARQPANETARNNLGLLLTRQNRREEALSLWSEKGGGAEAQQKLNQVMAALAQEQGRPAPVPAPEPLAQTRPPALTAPVAAAPETATKGPVKSESPLPAVAAPVTSPVAGPVSPAPPAAPPPNPWESSRASAALAPQAPAPPSPVGPVASETAKTATPVRAKTTTPAVRAWGKAAVAVVARRPAPPAAMPYATPAPPSAVLAEQLEQTAVSPPPAAPKAAAPAQSRPTVQKAQVRPSPPPEVKPRPRVTAGPIFAGGRASVHLARVTPVPSRPVKVKTAQMPASSPPAAAVRLEILNGNGVRGLAKQTARWLAGKGYEVAHVGNWWKFNLDKTVILCRPAFENEARKLSQSFYRPAGVQVEAELAEGVDLRVVLGRSHRHPESLWAGARPPDAPAPSAPAGFDKARVAATAASVPPQPQRPVALPKIHLTAEDLLSTRIALRNGNGIPEVARKSRSILSQEGFNVVDIGNHIDFGHEKTVIGYRPGAEKVAQALLQRFFPHGELKALDNLPEGLDIKIILGQDLKPHWPALASLAD